MILKEYGLSRISVDGGTIYDLTADIDQSTFKNVKGWRSDVTAAEVFGP